MTATGNNGDNAPDFSGPSFETLKKLHQQLPGMIKHVRKGPSARRGTPVVKTPRKWYMLCTAVFDLAVVTKPRPMQRGICPACIAQLEQGYLGMVDDEGRAAFVRETPELLEAMKDLTDKPPPHVLMLKPAQFDQIAQAHGIFIPPLPRTDEQPPPTNPTDPSPPPATPA